MTWAALFDTTTCARTHTFKPKKQHTFNQKKKNLKSKNQKQYLTDPNIKRVYTVCSVTVHVHEDTQK